MENDVSDDKWNNAIKLCLMPEKICCTCKQIVGDDKHCFYSNYYSAITTFFMNKDQFYRELIILPLM